MLLDNLNELNIHKHLINDLKLWKYHQDLVIAKYLSNLTSSYLNQVWDQLLTDDNILSVLSQTVIYSRILRISTESTISTASPISGENSIMSLLRDMVMVMAVIVIQGEVVVVVMVVDNGHKFCQYDHHCRSHFQSLLGEIRETRMGSSYDK